MNTPRRHGGHGEEDRRKLIGREVTGAIPGAAIEVHRELGPGLLESAYEECLCYELANRNIPHERQVELPVVYKGIVLNCGYRMDVLVHNLVVVEIKSVTELLPIHEAQLLTYLRRSRNRIGLLINFNVDILMKNGVTRLVL